MRAVASADVVATSFPSGENSAEEIASSWPRSSRSSLPSTALQMRALPSPYPAMNVFSSGEKAIPFGRVRSLIRSCNWAREGGAPGF